MSDQPRDSVGRFATAECPTTYRLLAGPQPHRAEPVLRQMPEASVPLSAVAICCPGCVYDSAEYRDAVRAWEGR